MPFNTTINTMKMLLNLYKTGNITEVVIKNDKASKPVINERKESPMLDRVSPIFVGFDLLYVDSFLNELLNEPSIHINRLMVLKGNKVVKEYYKAPYKSDNWDSCYSLTKTVVALGIGLLVDDGLLDLDEYAYDILMKDKPIMVLSNKKIKVRDLLTMSTGNKFNEVSTSGSSNWVKDFFNTDSKFPIGSQFEYNSLNTYILSAIVKEKAGICLSELVGERIFKKLGIVNYYFETSLEGIEKGGWGLYLTIEDMAKLGILIKDRGIYNNERIISEYWVSEMTKTQNEATKFFHRYDYGYQMWVNEEKNVSLFNGLFDQDILIYRNEDVIIVVNSSNPEAFHGSKFYDIADKYFLDGINKKIKYTKYYGERKLDSVKSLLNIVPILLNREFMALGDQRASTSILPLILQATFSTYSTGLNSMMFKKEKDAYTLCIKENDASFEIRFNFKDGIYQTLDIYGNKFELNSSAVFTLDEKGRPELIITINFLEFASTRYIKFKIVDSDETMDAIFTEFPDEEFALKLANYQDEKTKKALDRVKKLVDQDFVKGKVKGIFSPSLTLNDK